MPEQINIEGNKIKFEDVEDATFFKFEKIGDTLIGILTDKGQSSRYGFGLYHIMVDKEPIRFHGSTQLDGLLSQVDINTWVKIEYIDDQETPQGVMKIFKVLQGKSKK
jgi:hypothetical protein